MSFYRPPTTQGTLEALGTVYRAVRAWRFYPKGHPSRRSSLTLAHSALLELLDGNTLLLSCGRSGFSFPDGEFLKDPSGMTTALAYELFVRRAQKITFFHDLFQEDLLELIRILCMSPESIQNAGGIDTVMAERGIRSIWVNEFDLTAIRSKRQKVEQSGITPLGIDDAEAVGEPAPVSEPQPSQPDQLLPEQQLQSLLGRLATCVDDDIYLLLIRQAVACADSLTPGSKTHLLIPLIELLAGHADDQARSASMQECAQFAIEQIVSNGDVLQSVLERAGQGDEVTQKALSAVMRAGGGVAVKAAIELMGRTSSLKTRKKLSTMLASLGEAAVPALLNLMHDSRWFIVRNICAILGGIGHREALPALAKCLRHPDLRVRKEATRSLGQLGGHEAESAILAVLRGADAALFPQAIASLGGMQSRKALPELLKIVFAKDLFLKSVPLKIDALAAIALIGDRQVTPHLVTLLDERHLLAAARGKQLKSAVAACLGKIGDPRAVPHLEKFASDVGELGTACANAIAQIEKSEGRADGIS